MRKALRPIPLLVAIAALAVGAGPAAAGVPGEAAASKIVVRAKFESYSAATRKITYS